MAVSSALGQLSGMCIQLLTLARLLCPLHPGQLSLGTPCICAPLCLAPACVACFPLTLWTAGMGPTVRLAQWLPCRLAPPLHGSPASLAWPHVPPSHALHLSKQMAALTCATVTGDAPWVRTAGSVSARPAGEGPDATLPWKRPVLTTRITREVSECLLIPSPSAVVSRTLSSPFVFLLRYGRMSF